MLDGSTSSVVDLFGTGGPDVAVASITVAAVVTLVTT